MKRKIENIVMAVMTILSVGIILWMLISWVEIVSHNQEICPVYNENNFFEVFMD